MKLTIAAIISLAGVSSAFVVTGCTSGTSTNFGDNKCQIWTSNPFTYESDANCKLYAYSEGNCEGSVSGTTDQNQCFTAPFDVISINCVT